MKFNKKTLELIEKKDFQFKIVVRLLNTANAIGMNTTKYYDKLELVSEQIMTLNTASDAVYEDEKTMNDTMKALERFILPSINSQLLRLIHDLSDGLYDATCPVKEKKDLESLFL